MGKEWANNRNLKWYPYWTDHFIGASKEEIIHIPEEAEDVLLAALLDAKPELKTGELNELLECRQWKRFKNE